MTTEVLSERCAESASNAAKLLTSAYAILQADLPYFLELRKRLNAQGKSGEGWQKWVKAHFTCSTRTVNRALASITLPERKPRQKPSKKPQDKLTRSEEPEGFPDPFAADKEAETFNRETLIPLSELADHLMRVADELRCAHGLDGFADAIDQIAEKVEDREELNRRKQALDVKMSDGRPRKADDLIRHARRDRRFQEDMKLILKAGGTTYRGKKIMAAKSGPYIERYSRKEIIAEFKGDLPNQLGVANP